MIILIMFVFLFKKPVDCKNPCRCSGKTITGPLNLPIGRCLTKDPANNKFFCYINADSSCSDKALSGRKPNLHFSYQACDNDRACELAAPDYDYYSEFQAFFDEYEENYDKGDEYYTLLHGATDKYSYDTEAGP